MTCTRKYGIELLRDPSLNRSTAFTETEKQRHHPDIFLTWGKAEITTWTHKINGLTESDFILAAKIDQL